MALGDEFERFHYVHANLIAAHYALKESSMEDAFPELLERCEAVIEPFLEGKTEKELDPRTFPTLVAGATGFKHRGFFEEREVRIVAIPASDDARDRTLQEFPDAKLGPRKATWERDTPDGTRRHLKLFEDAGAKLPIKRLIVGPSSDQRERREQIGELVGDRFPIILSATPYLG